MKITNYYENLKTLHVNTLEDRCYYIPFADETDAKKKLREESSRFHLLNGDWRFGYYPNIHAVPDEICEDGYDPADYGSIHVPGVWQNQGYDKYHYVGVHQIMPQDIPYTPAENPCGVYVRDFEYDPAEGMNISELVFEGVDSCFYVWLNGNFVGYSQVSHAMSLFDVSSYIRKGNNVLVVLNLKFSDGTYFEDQDKWRCTGIFRDVYILERPDCRVEDYTIKPELSDDLSKADIQVEMKFSGKCDGEQVTLKLYDTEGNLMEEQTVECQEQVKAVFHVENAVLWNAEEPNLYTLTICGKEVIAERIGLKKVEIKSGIFYINGAPVKLKGVNRHDSNPQTGYAVDRAHIERDLRLMKQNNINMIRTAHYPCNPIMMDYTDQYGFYVMSEADMETHGITKGYGDGEFGPHKKQEYHTLSSPILDDPEFFEPVLDRIKKNPIRDRNRVSVFSWSLGNESGWGEAMERAAAWVKAYDPTRLVHYEGMYSASYRTPDYSNLDFIGRMYPTLEWIDSKYDDSVQWVREKELIPPSDEYSENYMKQVAYEKPMYLNEFSHAMGNGPGDLEEYVSRMYKYPQFAGGSVWEWCDHARYLGEERDGKPRYWYGGDSGEYPTDGNFCMDGLNYPDRRPHTGLMEYKNVLRPARAELVDNYTVSLQNMLNFLDLKDYIDITYELENNGTCIASGNVEVPSVLPDEKKEIKFEYELPEEGYVYLKLNFLKKTPELYMEKGFSLGFEQLKLEVKQPVVYPAVKAADAVGALEYQEVGRKIVVKGKNEQGSFRYTYDVDKAVFVSMTTAHAELLKKPMEYNIFRAPTDNDRGFARVYDMWKDAGYDRKVVRVYDTSVKMQGQAVVIESNLGIAAVSRMNFMTIKAVWTVNANGCVLVHMDVEKDMAFPYLPRFGLRLFTDYKHGEQVEYFGYGPQENYCDKNHYVWMSEFTSNANNLFEDYVRPQENGNHHNCRYLNVGQKEGHGLQVAAVSEKGFDFTVSYYSQEVLTAAKHNFEMHPGNETIICVDYKQSGVGSCSCGPALPEEYCLNEAEFTFEVMLIPR